MAVAQRSGRARYRLLLLILTAATLLTLDFRGLGPLAWAQSRVRDVLEPAVSATETVLGPVSEVWTVMFSYNDLRAENERLSEELARVNSADLRLEARDDAFDRLREATDIRYVTDVERLTATVLRYAVGNFDADVVSIDVGRRDGVKPGMAVVTAAGLAGRVETADLASSTVTALGNPALVVGVRLLDTGDVGLGQAMPGDPTKLLVNTELRSAATGNLAELPEVGTAVVTAAGSRYPSDIPVGRVAAVELGESGLVGVVTVDLAVDVGDLGFVTVLLHEPADEPPVGPDSPFGGLP